MYTRRDVQGELIKYDVIEGRLNIMMRGCPDLVLALALEESGERKYYYSILQLMGG